MARSGIIVCTEEVVSSSKAFAALKEDPMSAVLPFHSELSLEAWATRCTLGGIRKLVATPGQCPQS